VVSERFQARAHFCRTNRPCMLTFEVEPHRPQPATPFEISRNGVTFEIEHRTAPAAATTTDDSGSDED
jgi:hypothetical protein